MNHPAFVLLDQVRQSRMGVGAASAPLPVGRMVAAARLHGATLDDLRTAAEPHRLFAARRAVYAAMVGAGLSTREIAAWARKTMNGVRQCLRRSE